MNTPATYFHSLVEVGVLILLARRLDEEMTPHVHRLL